MEKVIRDGKVAVIISRAFGYGWYTSYYEEKLLFNPKLVEMIEQKRTSEINENWIKINLGIEKICCLSTSVLEIFWLPIGTIFDVVEKGGKEDIIIIEDLTLLIA